MVKHLRNKVVKRKSQKMRKPKKDNDKPSRTWKQWLFIIILVGFLGDVIYILFFSSLTQVEIIEINGTKRVDVENIRNGIKDQISGDTFLSVSRNNYFIAKTSAIEKNILKDKRIKEVHVKKIFPQKISINLSEYDVVCVWCVGNVERDNCFVLENGYAVSPVKLTDDIIINNDHFIIVDEAMGDINIGDRVLDEENIEKVKLLGEELMYVLNVGIEEPYVFASRGSHEVRFMTDEGWYVVIDLMHEIDDILEAMKLFVAKVELPSRRSDLEYIDMRFPEKIFYKMKDGVEKVEEKNDSQSVETEALKGNEK